MKLPGRKKQSSVVRSPHINRQKQSAFHYSSKRSQSDRPLMRQETPPTDEEQAMSTWQRIWRKFNRASYILGLLLFAALAVFLSLLTADPKLTITGNPILIRDTTQYNAFVADATTGPLNYSKLTINRKHIALDMQKQFPEIADVSVSTPLFANRASVKLQLVQPSMVLRSGSDTYVLDSQGRALLNTRTEKSPAKLDTLIVVTDISSTPIDVGKPALTSDQVRFIAELNHQATAKQMAFETVSLLAGGGELAVKYKDQAYYVKYNLNEDARKSFGTYLATKEHIEKAKTPPAEYIDVRVAERAYVK